MAGQKLELPGGWSFQKAGEPDMDAKSIYCLFKPDGRHYTDENGHPVMSHAGPTLYAFVEAMNAPSKALEQLQASSGVFATCRCDEPLVKCDSSGCRCQMCHLPA